MRKLQRTILHIDVNNAFLSWTAVEKLKQGEMLDIRTIPAVIGGDEASRHGIVLAKSMPAKQFGIKTGEPLFQARKKCPQIQVYPSNFAIYRKYSNELYQLFLEYTDKIERFSIDECFLDMTSFLRGRTILEIAQEIKRRVKEELGFTVNIGIAHNKLLAKMASDFQKPDRIHTLYEEEIEKKMWTLPVIELFMVGKRTLPKLEQMHIKTIGDLAHYDEQKLIKKFGKFGKTMWEYANGIDFSEVNGKQEKPKGIGNSITLSEDMEDIDKINEILLALVEQVTYRLRKEKLVASVVNVQIKTKDFSVFSHQRKLEMATDSTKEIYQIAKELLAILLKGRTIRLLGIRVDDLSDPSEKQISLFDVEKNEKQEKLDKTIDALKNKYGYNSVTRAGKMNLNHKMKFKE